MNSQLRLRSAILRLILLAALCAGCTATGSSNAGASVTGSTYDFVFMNWVVDPNDSSPSAGFNLDGLFSPPGDPLGCGVADRISDLDNDQNSPACTATSCQGGVDNALPAVVALLDCMQLESSRETLAGATNNGTLVTLLRISGVDDLTNDTQVSVALFHGFSTDVSCSTMFSGGGHFVASNDSLQSSGRLDEPLFSGPGSILNGRLSVSIPAPGFGPLQRFQLRVSLIGSSQTGSAGNLGGWIRASDLTSYLGLAFPRFQQILAAALPAFADLPGDAGSCGLATSAQPNGISFGLRFGLAGATITGTADSPPTFGCGTQAPPPAPFHTISFLQTNCPWMSSPPSTTGGGGVLSP